MRLTTLLGFLFLPILTPLAALAARVISIGDGDTQRVEEAGRKLIIRVAFVDAQESAQNPLRATGLGSLSNRFFLSSPWRT